jgi:VanZ family protein
MLRWAIWLTGVAAVLFAILDPDRRLPEIYPPWDKLGHFSAFYGLTLLAIILFPARRRYAFGFLFILAGLSELLQGLPLIHRDVELKDFLADVAGMIAAWLPAYFERLRAQRR